MTPISAPRVRGSYTVVPRCTGPEPVMADTLIRKAVRGSQALPNLADYSATCASFNWGVERLALRGLPGGGINIAFEALDRHVQNGRAGQVALRCLSREGVACEFTVRRAGGRGQPLRQCAGRARGG